MNNRPLRILLLEDNPDHAELIETSLKARNEYFQVDICDQREVFRSLLDENPYDAILIDYNLPKTNSLEILNELKEMDYEAPIIFISGTENEDVIAQVLQAGAADFIVKSRTSLKTLPILVKRNIIRKMALEERENVIPLYPTHIFRNLEDSIRKITRTSLDLTQNIAKGKLSMGELDEIVHLEKMLEKTANLLKKAKTNFNKNFSTPSKDGKSKHQASQQNSQAIGEEET